MDSSCESNSIKTKKCEICGKDFGCGANDQKPCWCGEVDLSSQTLRKLRETYHDCLCPDCLKQKAEEGRSTSTL